MSAGRCKVDRVVEEYGLEGVDPRHESIHEGLLARWRGDDGHEGSGYRTLTGWFNRRLLWRVCVDHARRTAGGAGGHGYQAPSGREGLRRDGGGDRPGGGGQDGEHPPAGVGSWGEQRAHPTDGTGWGEGGRGGRGGPNGRGRQGAGVEDTREPLDAE